MLIQIEIIKVTVNTKLLWLLFYITIVVNKYLGHLPLDLYSGV